MDLIVTVPDGDAAFVKKLFRKLGLPFKVVKPKAVSSKTEEPKK
jgi:hypothetical protein